MRNGILARGILLGALVGACSGEVVLPDGGPDASQPDASADRDGGPRDAGRSGSDAGAVDAGGLDAGYDAGILDAGAADAAPFDAGAFDASSIDASTFDASTLDASTLDASTLDAGLGEDAGLPLVPRPLGPLSTSVVLSRQPTFRWVPAMGTDATRITLCLDRACTTPIVTLDTTADRARPPAVLPSGVVFWRLEGLVGGSVVTAASATWQLSVGVRSAPIDASYGTILDVNGDGYADVAASAPWASMSTRLGRVHVYLGGATGLSDVPVTSLTGPDGPGAFGFTLASAGDVNGDGFADLLVGAPFYESVPAPGSRIGRVHLFLGGGAGLAATPDLTLAGPDGSDGLFGYALAGVGDVDADGYADVAIGAVGASTLRVYRGAAGGLDASRATVLAGTIGDDFGTAVAGVGDINGDGFSDLAVGASKASTVYVFLGGPRGPATTPASTLVQSYDFGDEIEAAGDLNGDGRVDLLVAAPGYLSSSFGRVFVYYGSSGGFTLAATVGTGDADLVGSYGEFGRSIDGAGDIDGDGYDDFVAGSPTITCTAPPLDLPNCGAIVVFTGGASGLVRHSFLRPPVGDMTSLFGLEVAGVGDIDADGFDDVAGAGPYGSPSQTGYVAVYRGSALGIPRGTAPASLFYGPDGPGGLFGLAID